MYTLSLHDALPISRVDELAQRLRREEWVVAVEVEDRGLRVDTTSVHAGEVLLPAAVAASGAELVAFNAVGARSEEHTSELQSPVQPVCRLLLEQKKLPWRARGRPRRLKCRNRLARPSARRGWRAQVAIASFPPWSRRRLAGARAATACCPRPHC